MIELLDRPKILAFIEENLNKDVSSLALKYKEVDGVPIQAIIQQIQGKKKAKGKLPTWYATDGVIFPPTLNLEQSSSEVTALYKAKIIKGNSIVDLTGGFGVDCYGFSKYFKKVYYVERNPELSELVRYNFNLLNAKNLVFENTDALDFVKRLENVDCIYLDPARRDKTNSKVFKLQECEPDVLALKKTLFQKTNTVLVKTSPLLDIKAGLNELENVSAVHVLAVENDCKELLFVMQKSFAGKPELTTVNFLKKGEQIFKFRIQEEEESSSHYALPQRFLYEPNSAILKAGAFNVLSGHFNLKKLHPNSHLYTSEDLKKDFPGRTFEIMYSSKYDKKEVNRLLGATQANITVRNFYDSVEIVRKKLGLKEGGDKYIFATIDSENKPVILITRKLDH